MTDYGSEYTDRRQKIIEWRLLKTYREAQRNLFKKADSYARRFAKEERAKQRQVAAGTITEQDYRDWRIGKEFAGKQWDAKVRQATEVLLNYNQRALDIIRGEQYNVFAENANYQAYCHEKDFKGGISFDIYDETTVERLIREKPELLPPKKINGKKDRAWNQGIIANCVTQGIIQGESINDIAKRIARDTASRNDKSMVRYARTAMTAAQNSGRLETMHRAQDMGIKVKKVWMATLDDRTRDAHADLDGESVNIDEPFVNELGEIDYPGDPGASGDNTWNCRCSLGYEYPDYENIAEQENNVRYDQEYDEEIENMDYEDWVDWRKEQIKEKYSDTPSLQTDGDKYFDNNLKRTGQERDELPTDEDKIKAIMDYTGLSKGKAETIGEALFGYNADPDHCYFYGDDGVIRRRETPLQSKRTDEIQDYIDSAPKYEGRIYRGIALPQDMLDKLVVGTEFSEQQYAVSSWSSREDVSQRYASQSSNTYGGERVVFEYLNPLHGTPVAHLSPTPIEQEVLVNNRVVRYNIVKREDYYKESKANGRRKFTRIVLEEIEE